TADEIEPGTGKLIQVNGLEIAVFNVGGQFYASGAVCPHEGGPLEDGTLDGEVVICPWHGFDFDLKTGECLVDSDLRVPTYPVKVEGDTILVETP
ncbi:MAG: Rieske (2Fe-2S) protein, partial [Candidatus Rokubacteria bacterium]|nr:Rieske (2Fe-2S) protein [Candidatus Rokubacteria bacterium]